MPLAALQTQVLADPFAAVRALNRMKAAGFSLTVRADKLVAAPAEHLTEQQRAYIRHHKAALVGLLSDANELHAALVEAGPAGLGWREGTAADWSDDRLLAAGEVLYGDGRMVNHHDRRYCSESAPAIEEGPEYPPPAESPEIASCAAELGKLAGLDVGRMLAGDLTEEDWSRITSAAVLLSERHPDKSDELTALVARIDTAYSGKVTP